MTVERWNVRRFDDPDLVAVALWDACLAKGPARGASVYERLGWLRVDGMRREGIEDGRIASNLASDLVEVLQALHAGETIASDGEPGATDATGFDRAFVEGRVLELAGFRAALGEHATQFDIALAPPRPTCVELGAERLLHRITDKPSPHTLVVDVGHTAVRTVALGGKPRRLSFERNFSRLPLARGSVPPPSASEEPGLAERGVELIARAVAASLTEETANDTDLVLSMPCNLDADGIPGPCTYPGWKGNQTLIARILASIDEQIDQRLPASAARKANKQGEVWLLSHAELVALATEAAIGAPRTGGTLAISVGFGPGAAILRSAT